MTRLSSRPSVFWHTNWGVYEAGVDRCIHVKYSLVLCLVLSWRDRLVSWCDQLEVFRDIWVYMDPNSLGHCSLNEEMIVVMWRFELCDLVTLEHSDMDIGRELNIRSVEESWFVRKDVSGIKLVSEGGGLFFLHEKACAELHAIVNLEDEHPVWFPLTRCMRINGSTVDRNMSNWSKW